MTKAETLMRFAYCDHCQYRERLADDADSVSRMCNGCGHFGSYRLIGVTDPAIAALLRAEFPDVDAPTKENVDGN